MKNQDIKLTLDGMGIVIYSNKALMNIEEGADYFTKEFSSPQKVSEHIKKGDIIGFNMGSSGTYNLHVRQGYPNLDMIKKYPINARLALNVLGNKISFIDLYWLMEWSNFVPEEQTYEIEEGIYHVSVLTNKPFSGKIGDNQDVFIYFQKINEMPELTWEGVPIIF
ncbi:MAG: hypothetical protein K5754_13505 [Butyrivibrio sp.]|nr:hypothetical protein [Butyrivibrio sp.]